MFPECMICKLIITRYVIVECGTNKCMGWLLLCLCSVMHDGIIRVSYISKFPGSLNIDSRCLIKLQSDERVRQVMYDRLIPPCDRKSLIVDYRSWLVVGNHCMICLSYLSLGRREVFENVQKPGYDHTGLR